MFGWSKRGRAQCAHDAAIELRKKNAVLALQAAINSKQYAQFQNLTIPRVYTDNTIRSSYTWAVDRRLHIATISYTEKRGLQLIGEFTCRLHYKGDRFLKAVVESYSADPWCVDDVIEAAISAWKLEPYLKELGNVEVDKTPVFEAQQCPS